MKWEGRGQLKAIVALFSLNRVNNYLVVRKLFRCKVI